METATDLQKTVHFLLSPYTIPQIPGTCVL